LQSYEKSYNVEKRMRNGGHGIQQGHRVKVKVVYLNTRTPFRPPKCGLSVARDEEEF